MAQEDFPLCIYCDNASNWYISHEDGQVVYTCGDCKNTVIVRVVDA